MWTVGKRSPVLGYNHNFKHRGLIFHVQTEDSGVDNPHLFTHLFHGGVIISSRRMDYDADSEVDVVKSLMQSQHKAVLKDLKIGTFDDKIDAYLGKNPDLLPRKGGRADTVAETSAEDLATTQNVSNAAAEAVARHEAESAAQTGQGLDLTLSVSDHGAERAAAEARARAEAAAAEEAAARVPVVTPPSAPVPHYIDNNPTIPNVPPGAAIKLDIPDARARIPTPIAVPVVSGDALGDPMVTFSTARSTPPPPADDDDRSGAYSMRRAARSATEYGGRHTPGKPPSREPSPAKAYPSARAGGKASNPEPGRPRSSVVVSRPAVIIGAPPNMVGKDKPKRSSPAPRKARAGNLFGKDMISEKSLDEVIMAYLSEDGSEE